jgi:inosine-uridine nucleoside N-ribohydrolase
MIKFNGGLMRTQFNIRLDKKAAEQVLELAYEEGMTGTEYCRKIVLFHLSKKEKEIELRLLLREVEVIRSLMISQISSTQGADGAKKILELVEDRATQRVKELLGD